MTEPTKRWYVTLTLQIDAEDETEAHGVALDCADETIYNHWVNHVTIGTPTTTSPTE